MIQFVDRTDAAEQLLPLLEGSAFRWPLVLALPRGGVPVGHRVAQALRAELDVLVVRKLGHPDNPELALGAIAWGGVRVLNWDLILRSQVSEGDIDRVIETEARELFRRESSYRGDRPMPAVRGRSVLIVDDGIATGATILVAAEAVRRLGPHEVVLIAPVAPVQVMPRLRRVAERVIVAHLAEDLGSVGEFYQSFDPVSDGEVRRYLHDAWDPPRRRSGVIPAFGTQLRRVNGQVPSTGSKRGA